MTLIKFNDDEVEAMAKAIFENMGYQYNWRWDSNTVSPSIKNAYRGHARAALKAQAEFYGAALKASECSPGEQVAIYDAQTRRAQAMAAANESNYPSYYFSADEVRSALGFESRGDA